jgi:hypothetical protein
MSEAAHPRRTLATNIGSKHRPKPVPPHSDGLVADVDAALEQQILDVPQRKREADVHHDHEPDHFG